ncbi:MAG TPA: hypothetical protein DCK99_13170 [Blastocatellia bacterium]|nr:hypothetical protein [Blastocatellia bacterium]
MPPAVDALTVRVRVEEVVAGFGLKFPVVPDGRPLTEKVTGELKPLVGLIVTVYTAVPPPRVTLTDEGLIESE